MMSATGTWPLAGAGMSSEPRTFPPATAISTGMSALAGAAACAGGAGGLCSMRAAAIGVEIGVELADRLRHRLDNPHVERVRHRLVVVGRLVMVGEVLDAEVEARESSPDRTRNGPSRASSPRRLSVSGRRGPSEA